MVFSLIVGEQTGGIRLDSMRDALACETMGADDISTGKRGLVPAFAFGPLTQLEPHGSKCRSPRGGHSEWSPAQRVGLLLPGFQALRIEKTGSAKVDQTESIVQLSQVRKAVRGASKPTPVSKGGGIVYTPGIETAVS